MVNLSQGQLLRQQQTLSPQQIQMVKLLELPTLQLEQRIKQEIEENPVLEEEKEETRGNEENDAGEQGPKEISVDEYLREDDTPSYKTKANNYSKDDKQLTPTISGGRSLHEYLIEQLGYKSLGEREMTLAQFLVGSIDDDGYLRRDLGAVADDIAFMLGIDTNREELEQILHIIHELEPAGIGARDLQECLVLQLESLSSESRERQLAMRILTQYFDEFTKKHFDRLMMRLGIDQEEFRLVMEEITHLSPKPGNLYNEGVGSDTVPYVTPDFLLDVHGDEFTLSLNSWNVPEVKISKRYLDMLRGMSGKALSQDDKETVHFIKNKIESAKWFISAIQQRHDTLMHTMTEILDHQRAFFETGDMSDLRPMKLKDIAQRTHLDVSTISRVVNSKYVQTPFGVVLLKDLFSEAMPTDDGEVSSYEIKQILKECVDGEDKRHPIKDEVLMDILNARGYHIARRTVAKYREMLGIPVARLRKEL